MPHPQNNRTISVGVSPASASPQRVLNTVIMYMKFIWRNPYRNTGNLQLFVKKLLPLHLDLDDASHHFITDDGSLTTKPAYGVPMGGNSGRCGLFFGFCKSSRGSQSQTRQGKRGKKGKSKRQRCNLDGEGSICSCVLHFFPMFGGQLGIDRNIWSSVVMLQIFQSFWLASVLS